MPTTDLGVNICMVLYKALHDALQPPLTSHVEGGGTFLWGDALTPGYLTGNGGGGRGLVCRHASQGAGRTVDVCAIPDEEAGSGCVLQQDGSVKECPRVAVWAAMPRIGITTVHHLVK